MREGIGVPRREPESVGGSRGRMKQGEESAAVEIIKHRYGSTAQIILGTASGCQGIHVEICIKSCKNQEDPLRLVHAAGRRGRRPLQNAGSSSAKAKTFTKKTSCVLSLYFLRKRAIIISEDIFRNF